jgi:biopolymer transport protein ExbD
MPAVSPWPGPPQHQQKSWCPFIDVMLVLLIIFMVTAADHASMIALPRQAHRQPQNRQGVSD